MKVAEQSFHEIKVVYTKAAVHVDSDDKLKAYMGYRMKKALVLAGHILEKYQAESGEKLAITKMSLAVELVGHFAMQELFLRIRKVCKALHLNGKPVKFCDFIIRHTEVIDCGEKHCDGNRFIWDILAKPIGIFYRKYR